jgi:hypothetical protein
MTGAITFAGAQPTATTSTAAIVQLSNSISSTSETLAATPKAVKDAKDDAVSTAASGAAALYLPTATAASTYLPLAGGTMTGVITYATAQPRFVVGTAQPSTSGPEIDFTSIPSWAKRVTVVLDQVSCNNAGSNLLIQLGTSSGVESTGYLAYGSANYYSSNGATEAQSSFVSATGFLAQFGLVESFRSGHAIFTNITGNRWIGSLNIAAAASILSPPASVYGSVVGGGSKQLSGVLDRVRITWDATATFDLGNINIIYEG